MRATSALLVFVALIAAGCGSTSTAKSNAASPNPTAPRKDGAPALEAAVRRALIENSQLSFYTLSHNAVPTWGQRSTRGPALAGLQTSAAQRKQQGIEIHHIAGHLEILSVRLDPSYTAATATVRASDRLQPYRNGHALGRVVAQNERARIQLHRLGRLPRFVVWKVVLLR